MLRSSARSLVALAIVSLAAALTPRTAHAGVGFTAGGYAYSDGTNFAPSIDYRAKGWLVQVHLLDLLAGPAAGGKFGVNTGLDVTKEAMKRKVGPEVEGVFMPGLGFRVADSGIYATGAGGGSSVGFNVMAEGRLGAEMKKGIGFGMYVVPAVGISDIGGGKIRPNYGGGVEVSAWFADGGGGAAGGGRHGRGR